MWGKKQTEKHNNIHRRKYNINSRVIFFFSNKTVNVKIFKRKKNNEILLFAENDSFPSPKIRRHTGVRRRFPLFLYVLNYATLRDTYDV